MEYQMIKLDRVRHRKGFPRVTNHNAFPWRLEDLNAVVIEISHDDVHVLVEDQSRDPVKLTGTASFGPHGAHKTAVGPKDLNPAVAVISDQYETCTK